jgi:hypothetical protein
MPDLFTHFTSGIIFAKTGIPKYRLALLVLGCSFPDILTRIPVIVFNLTFKINIENYLLPLHTPIGILISIYLFCFLFEEKNRKECFLYILFGAFLHLGLDVLQTQFFKSDYFLLFPFSFYAPEINLFYYDKSIDWFFPEFFLVIFVIYPIVLKRKSNV